MNDRQLTGDEHQDRPPYPQNATRTMVGASDAPEPPTPCPEILIELVRRVSALEEEVHKLKSNQSQ